MNKINKPVELVYKAAITQRTGESWDDVPIILETATPTDNVTIPKLNPWRVSVYVPPPPPRPLGGAMRARSIPLAEVEEESDDDMGCGLFDGGNTPPPQAPPMTVHSAFVLSHADITTTIR